ncbi:MAG: ATP-binding protein [Planctomycetota bacterium]
MVAQMMKEPADRRWSSTLGGLAGWGALLLGVWSLLAWSGVASASWTDGVEGPPLTPMSAIAIVALAAASLATGRERPALRHLGAGLALLIAVVTLLDYMLGLDGATAGWLLHERLAEAGGDIDGRPSPWTAAVALLLAVAIGIESAAFVAQIRQVATALALAVVWTVLFGYASTSSLLFRMQDRPSVGMSWATALAMLLIVTRLVIVTPNVIRDLLRSRTAGGWVARVLLPVSVLVPLVIAWFVVAGTAAGQPSPALSISWAATSILTSVAVVWIAVVQVRASLHRRRDELRHERLVERLAARNGEIARLNDDLGLRVEQATEELRLRAAALERSNADLQQFAFVASHDLRTPLRSITGFLQMLLDDDGQRLDEQGRDWVQRCLRASERLTALVTSLLSYARIDAKPTPFEQVALDDVVAHMVDELVEAAAAGAVVTRDHLPEVVGDPVQLSLVLRNLIENGLRYHRDGEAPRVHVGVERVDGAWRVAVRDHGIGIEPRHREQVFEIFQRLHAPSRYPGSGVGLAIVRRVVERHGGRVWIEDVDGPGSCFVFTVPVATPSANRTQP